MSDILTSLFEWIDKTTPINEPHYNANGTSSLLEELDFGESPCKGIDGDGRRVVIIPIPNEQGNLIISDLTLDRIAPRANIADGPMNEETDYIFDGNIITDAQLEMALNYLDIDPFELTNTDEFVDDDEAIDDVANIDLDPDDDFEMDDEFDFDPDDEDEAL